VPGKPRAAVATDEDIQELVANLERLLQKPSLRHGYPGDMAPALADRLGDIGPRATKALPGLETLSSDSDEKARNAALKAIARIKGDVIAGSHRQH
jgi:hypothetical protein